MARGKKVELNGITYRSKFELRLAQQLIDAGVKFKYESEQWEYYYEILEDL